MEHRTDGSGRSESEVLAPLREWMVEYVVERDGVSPEHCLSLIEARDVQEAQERLFDELKGTYEGSSRLDVTVQRMEPVLREVDEGMFDEDLYAP